MMTIVRKITLIFLCLTLCWTTVACGGSSRQTNSQFGAGSGDNAPVSAPTQLNDGQYPVQQVTYSDADGEYTLFLLNTPPGTPPTFRIPNLPMARLTDEDIKAGQKVI